MGRGEPDPGGRITVPTLGKRVRARPGVPCERRAANGVRGGWMRSGVVRRRASGAATCRCGACPAARGVDPGPDASPPSGTRLARALHETDRSGNAVLMVFCPPAKTHEVVMVIPPGDRRQRAAPRARWPGGPSCQRTCIPKERVRVERRASNSAPTARAGSSTCSVQVTPRSRPRNRVGSPTPRFALPWSAPCTDASA